MINNKSLPCLTSIWYSPGSGYTAAWAGMLESRHNCCIGSVTWVEDVVVDILSSLYFCSSAANRIIRF